VSTTLVANLPPVSTTPAANFATDTTGVVDTGDNQDNNQDNIRLQTPYSELKGRNFINMLILLPEGFKTK
jgi:hypothetical protein